MGPTNVALVRLFKAETQLREAQRRLDAVTKNVRLQERKVEDLTARQRSGHTELVKLQAKNGELDLEAKSREVKIEQLRTQQAQAQTNREYQAFLVEINTHKVDKGKIEEDQLKLMEQIESLQKAEEALAAQLVTESAKYAEMKSQIDQRVTELTAEVDTARPSRDDAASVISAKAREIFYRLAEKFDGEAMAPIEKPHPKREEYICSVCNLDLTLDIYNRLHTRDEPIMCPSGNHLLYIPEDLPPEKAVHRPKEKKAKGRKETEFAAPIPLQSLATSVVRSVDQEEPDESEEVSAAAPASPTTAASDPIDETQPQEQSTNS